jgi:hypothetical protein
MSWLLNPWNNCLEGFLRFINPAALSLFKTNEAGEQFAAGVEKLAHGSLATWHDAKARGEWNAPGKNCFAVAALVYSETALSPRLCARVPDP